MKGKPDFESFSFIATIKLSITNNLHQCSTLQNTKPYMILSKHQIIMHKTYAYGCVALPKTCGCR